MNPSADNTSPNGSPVEKDHTPPAMPRDHAANPDYSRHGVKEVVSVD